MTAPKLGIAYVIWTCPCGLTVRHAYRSERRFQRVDKYGMARYGEAIRTRIHDDGRTRDLSWDTTCPCGRQRTGADVRGRVTDHVCDARCEGATGPNCDCSCGGKNHGKAYAS